MPPLSPSCWRQIPWLWNKTHPFMEGPCWKVLPYRKARILFPFLKKKKKNKEGPDQDWGLKREDWRESHHFSRKFWISLVFKDSNLSFPSEPLQWKDPPLLWSLCWVRAVDLVRSQKAWSWWFQKKQGKVDCTSDPLNNSQAWSTKTGCCSCTLSVCLLEERKVTIRKKRNHVSSLPESSTLTAWSGIPVCVDQHVGQRRGNLRNTDSEPQHRL